MYEYDQSLICRGCGAVISVSRVTRLVLREAIPSKTLCKSCKGRKGKLISEHMKERHRLAKVQTGIQKQLCKRCKCVIQEVEVHMKRVLPTVYATRLCTSCIEESSRKSAEARRGVSTITPDGRRRLSSRMRVDNPMKQEATAAKVREANIGSVRPREAYSPEVIAKRLAARATRDYSKSNAKNRERMLTDNPMCRPEIADKVSHALRRRKLEGKSLGKRGPRKGNWVGKREFCKLVRSRLYPWITLVMQRDGFKCTRCGVSGLLHVHHIKPLREIMTNVLRGRVPQSSDEASKLADEIVGVHTVDFGITVCPACHAVVDSRYRRKRHAGNKDRQGEVRGDSV